MEILKTHRLHILALLLLLFSFSGIAQNITLVSTLDTTVYETSGLIFLNQRLITHNDSGGEPALYEVDTSTGEIERKVVVRNAVNRDWEDICCDDNYIYIGDFGNNFGNRQDLRIFRISITDYFATKSDSVDAEIINFKYADQTDFSPDPFFTNYDTEALISFKDSLYIFTKNWGDNLSRVYACPKIPGSYTLDYVDVLNPKGLVTGAVYNDISNSIYLSGYIHSFPFLMEVKEFTSNRFSDGVTKRYLLPRKGSTQIEGITDAGAVDYYFSSETNKKGSSTLYSFSSLDLSEMKSRETRVVRTLIIRLISRVKNSSLFNLLWKSAMLLYL